MHCHHDTDKEFANGWVSFLEELEMAINSFIGGKSVKTDNISSLHYKNDPAGTTGYQRLASDNLGKDKPST